MTWPTGRTAIAAMLLFFPLLLPAAARAAEPPQGSWLTLLKIQLKEGYNCTYGEMLYWRNVPLGADLGTEGRVRCIDRREYAFTRPREHERFAIRLCQPTVC